MNKIYTIKNGIVLDVGCNDGRVAIEFAKQGNKVVAVDKKLPKQRHKHKNIKYIEKDILGFEIEKGKYDLIFARNVLPFIGNKILISKVLQKCQEGLKEGGILDFTLFGVKDVKFNEQDKRVFYIKKELPKLSLKQIYFSEILGYLPKMNGETKFWHIFRFAWKRV